MKQTKTTLKELTAMYRAVLRHGILCNAIALGLIAAPAMAAYTPQESYTEQNAKLELITAGGTTIDGVSASGITAVDDDCGAAMSIKYSDPTDTGLTLVKNSLYSGNKALGDEADSAAFNLRLGNVKVQNTKFLNNEAMTGGAIYTYLGNVSSTNKVGYGKLVIKDSVFEGNIASGEDNDDIENGGGAIVNVAINSRNGGDAGMWISDTQFIGNKNTKNNLNGGGAINVGSQSRTNITDSQFIGNTSASRGGAISGRDFDNGENHEAVMDIVGSVFKGNTAVTTGGAIDNTLYDSDTHDGSVYISGTTFGGTEEGEGNSAANGGAIYNHVSQYGQRYQGQTGNMYLTGTSFVNNAANSEEDMEGRGGAVYNEGVMTIDGTFDGNTATNQGGAVFNYGELNIDGATFTGNKTTSIKNPSQGGAIFNSGDDDYLDVPSITANISNTTFGDKNDVTKGNQALQGGAIANESSLIDGEVTLTNVNFYNNKAFADTSAEGKDSSLGGAIWNQGVMTVNGDTEFVGNKAEGFNVEGGAIYNSGSLTFNDEVTFDSNTSTDINSGNGAFGGALSIGWTGETVFKKNATFTGNKALSTADKGTQGGAIFNGNTVTFENGATFSENEAVYGGAVFNDDGTVNLTDASFTGNVAGDEGGAIFTLNGTVNINAVNDNVVFSGNTAGGQVNDITNYGGVVNLNAASGKTISLNGIDGKTFYGDTPTINIIGAGNVEISEYIAKQTVNVDAGELHLTTGEANLYQSTVNVASGATINTIDNLVNDYTGAITLTDGANIKGDIDFMNGTADKYLSTGATSVNYKVGNLIGSVGNGTKNIQVASDGTTVNDAGFAWATSTEGLSLVSSGNADGMVAVTGLSGGIAEATDVSANVNEIDYTLTAAETLTTAKTMYHNFALTGGGTNDTDNGLNLAANLSTDENASVKISKLKLSGSGTLNNAGLMHINDSLIDVDVNNSGVLISDPTTYSGTVTNSNFASFDNDTFTATATLANTGTVSLYNGVTFDAGASITGAGVTNLVSGYTHFHDTANANTINVVSGANFDGAIVGGKINTQNGMIDNFAGSIQNMDVAMDVNTASGTADTFASITGSTIKSLSVSGGYGTADSVDVTIGSGLTLDSATEINGGYYTKVEQSGTTLTFSDKLVNASGMQANAAKADYSASGTYADGTIGKAIQGKQDTLTAGDAITISSDSNISVADSGITTGKLADGAVTTDKIADGTITFADLNAGAVATSTTVNLASPSDEKLVTEKAVVAGITNLVAEKETWVNNTLGITAANPNAVNDEYVGTNYLTSATTLTGADIALDSAIKANANDIAKIVDGTTVVAKAYADEDGNNIKTTYATKAEVTAGVTAVYDHAHDWAESLLGLDVDENVANQLQNGLAALGGTNNIEATTIAGALHELDTEKQNIITDTATIAADGTGFSVVAGSIDTAQLKDGGVTADKLADGAVTSGKVADGAITTAKIADGTITFADLNAGMVVKSGTDVNIATPSEEKLVTEKAVVEGITSLVEQKQAWVDATLGITSANANAVNNEYTGTTYLTAATTLTGADKALDAEIVRLDADETITGSVAKKVKDNARNATYDNSTSALLATTLQGAIDENASNTGNLGTLSGNHVTANTSVVSNLNQLSAAIDAAADSTLAAANTYTDQRVESMDKNLSAGVAGAVALSSVAVSQVTVPRLTRW